MADIPSFLTEQPEPRAYQAAAGSLKTAVIEKSAVHAASVLRTAFLQAQISSSAGLLQSVDARVKVLLLIVVVIVVSVKRALLPEAMIAVFLLGLAALSRIPLISHYGRILLLTFLFGFLLALPAACNIVTPGEIILPLWRIGENVTIGPVAVPAVIGVTAEGLRRIAMLSMRVLNSLSVTLLVLATTPFMEFIRALRFLRVPDVFLLTITLAFKYLLIFTTTVFDMHLAKLSRMIRPERPADSRAWTSGRIAFLFRKSQLRCDDIVRAMRARGMTSAMKLRPLPPLAGRDAAAAAGIAAASLLFLWM
ncbi:MAG: hypothetical protein HGA43_00645 [Nitrospirae bacterium]|nr:hypothetical protein [Nitrospirota bacterium]